MKGGSWNSLRGKQFLLTIFGLISTSIFLWAWEKTPFVSTLLPQQDQFKVLSPCLFLLSHIFFIVSLKHKLDVEVDSPNVVEEQEETTNQRGPDFDKHKTGVEEHFSKAAEERESKNRQPEHISDEDKKGEEQVSSLPTEPRDTRTVEPSQGVGGAEIDSMNVSTSEKRKGDEDLTKSPVAKKGCLSYLSLVPTSCFLGLYLQALSYSSLSSLQGEANEKVVIMPRASGSLTVKGHCILVLVVNNGYLKCGHVG